MTFQKIKKQVVDEQKRMTDRQLTKLAVNLALAYLGICITLCTATMAILGVPVTILVIAFTLVTYNVTFNLFVEDSSAGKHIVRFSRLWWIQYILFAVVFFILKYNRFM